MKKKPILFVNPGQFGYKAGYFYYCKYLSDDYKIDFICLDQGLDKVHLDGINVFYISSHDNKYQRHYSWIKSVVRKIKSEDYDIVFTVYFKLCFLLALLLPTQRYVLDIRSGSLKGNRFMNWLENVRIRFESLFFRNITILSIGLIDRLRLPYTKCHLLPLGSEELSSKNKSFEKLKLLYVGTLINRSIHETIEGINILLKDNQNLIGKISYDIVGFGLGKDDHLIYDAIKKNGLSGTIIYHGRKNHNDLKGLFNKCNVGVAYVPLTYYYDVQPSTKLFEYVLSGMVCIATDTYENRININKVNGVICDDNPHSFSEALYRVYNIKNQYNSHKIRKSLSGHYWENIVNNNLSNYFISITKDRYLNE